jgi:hypothetical protein
MINLYIQQYKELFYEPCLEGTANFDKENVQIKQGIKTHELILLLDLFY